MNSVTIKKIPFKLRGETIKEGKVLNFKAENLDKEIVDLSKIGGLKVISAFPDINTGICDFQTKEIRKFMKLFPTVKFFSISTDKVEVLKKWCLANSVSEKNILSDYKLKEFGEKTNLLITKIKKLVRAYLVLDNENKIVKIIHNKEISKHLNYELLKDFLKKNI